MPKNKSKTDELTKLLNAKPTGNSKTEPSSSAPVLPQDIAALLNSKIKEFEQNKADETEKNTRAQIGKAKVAAKTKLKDAKQLMAATDVPDEEKVARLLERLEAEHEQVQQVIKEQQKSRQEIAEVEKDRDACQAELNRSLKVKAKLESLCKQLQQQTNALMDERRRLSEMERQRRQELADEFQLQITDVKATMDEQTQERARLARENEDLRSRFKKFFEQYDTREKERLESQQGRDLEVQVLESKLAEHTQLYRQEATKEAIATRENDELLQAEKTLREQLHTYSAKFNQFQDSLSKSDKVLGQYKRQRNKMERRVETLEKENAELRTRSDRKLATLLKEKEGAAREKEKLQERCKRLQGERTTLLQEQQMLTGQNGGG